jgi:ATP-dependent RNA helicase DeaD
MRRGSTRVLVATDVAARGIDVPAIAFVIQIEAPNDPDTYTHRSGRTGRAGRKGTSALLIPPAALRRATSLLSRARVRHRIEPIPSAEAIRDAEDQRAFAELTREPEGEIPARIRAQVQKLVEAGFAERALTQLLLASQKSSAEPRAIQVAPPQQERNRPFKDRAASFRDLPRRDRDVAPRSHDNGFAPRSFDRGFSPRSFDRAHTGPGPARGPSPEAGDWVAFHVTWGEEHGADPRRLVAMLCRRGGIHSSDIGAIRVNRKSSSVQVAARVSEGFRNATRGRDSRDPNVMISAAPAHRDSRQNFAD